MQNKKLAVYIAGPMAGLPNKNREAFASAAKQIEEAGHIPLNPAMLPDGLDGDRYIPICLAMLEQADVVLMLDGWEESDGASLEFGYASYQGKKVIQIAHKDNTKVQFVDEGLK